MALTDVSTAEGYATKGNSENQHYLKCDVYTDGVVELTGYAFLESSYPPYLNGCAIYSVETESFIERWQSDNGKINDEIELEQCLETLKDIL